MNPVGAPSREGLAEKDPMAEMERTVVTTKCNPLVVAGMCSGFQYRPGQDIL